MQALGLAQKTRAEPEEIVRSLGAVQSQDYGPAKWSIGQRLQGSTDSALDDAVDSGRILRTHVLRPTWHLVLPEDIRWMLELTAPRVRQLSSYYLRQLELTPDAIDRGLEVINDALTSGDHLTRRELGVALAESGIETESMRLGYICSEAELAGLICNGARRGKQHTYALLEDRAPGARKLTHDEALAELTLRYFTSHGPSTVHDFRWWSSLKIADIRRGLEMVGSELRSIEGDDGRTYWSSAAAPRPRKPTAHVLLLQPYDEYLVGYTETKYVIDIDGRAREAVSGAPAFNGVVVADTQVVGRWKRRLSRDSVLLQVALYRPLSSREGRSLDATVEDHGRFLGLPASLELV